ncbi:MAG: SUMF1/EgtB/PvdO family nonheme iron enzyme, partial [Bryobacteraceae bacterium]|nr:SUMF1/EgtB/PvdO family nonheme iron enzyme [Bryobacteraceae bacterium]
MTALALVLLLAQDTRSIPLPGSTQPLVFRSIPAGSFTMGSPDNEAGRDRDESPAHPVTISRPFFLAIHEVTQAQWAALMGHNPSVFQQRHPEGGDPALRPVDSVSFDDVQRFLARLNALGLGRFRLPTEAEWEYVTRAGSTTRFSFGDATNLNEVHRYAWTNSRSYGTTHPVGSKPANAWGLYDMHGNVWEWCADWYAPYPAGPQTDPRGPASGSERVFRGGSYFDFPIALRSANRHRHAPQRGYTAIGFRLAADSLEGTEPANLTRLPGGVTLAFVRIPQGSFTIGSPTDETGRANDESPRPTVTISRDFDLGKFEVTQAQWRA